jgi:glycerophosphoryl diester phosphodiesterase
LARGFSVYRKKEFVTLVIGHKGASADLPENSVAAFARAKELGADGVEFDVRRAAGDDLVVWHDPTLPDGRVLIDHSGEALADGVASLDSVLDVSDGMRLVNVEIKNWVNDSDFDATLAVADTVAASLAARGPGIWDAYVVSCFHLDTIDRARVTLDSIAPAVRTGWLLWAVDDVDKIVATAVERRHAALHPFFTAVTPELLDAAHAAGLTVNCWTCNDMDEVRRLADLGIDGIITDRPADALAALGR